jgi:SAM-dependent methyltransferase
MTSHDNQRPGESDIDNALGSPERFGYEWNTYDKILPEYEIQFRRWTPFFTDRDWLGKEVLDVGCGMGRNSYWILCYGASNVVAIDLDEQALASARRNLAMFPNALVIQRSAYELGFDRCFDVAVSLGVIHHLQYPHLALSQMTKAIKQGGKILIWVYGLENNEWIVKFFNPFRKALFSRLPINLLHHLSLYPTIMLWLLLHAGLGRIAYYRLLRTFEFRHLRSIVFDQMLPKIANYWSHDEVQKIMSDAGLTDICTEWVNEMSWAAIGTKTQ